MGKSIIIGHVPRIKSHPPVRDRDFLNQNFLRRLCRLHSSRMPCPRRHNETITLSRLFAYVSLLVPLLGLGFWGLLVMELVASSTADGMQKPRDAKHRSRVANGNALLPGVDGRSAWVRRARELLDEHLVDLGGADVCSAAERSIVRRAAVLSVELEMLESRFANDGQASSADLDLYQRAASALRRLLETIGIERGRQSVQAGCNLIS